MKFTVTGSLGNISKPIIQTLIAAGHEVTVISSDAKRAADIEALKATPAIGSVEDIGFLTKAFTGADAVYTMVPPKWDAADWKTYIGNIGRNYAKAIQQAGVKYVVNLSSVGAQLKEGAGPVSGLYQVEQALNALEGVNVLHLRPGFFYYNFFSNIGMIKHMDIIGGNYDGNASLILADTNDIADVAANAFLQLSFKGKSINHIASDKRIVNDIATALGKAIGKPDLKWVPFSDEQLKAGMIQNGLTEEVASNYAEMGQAVSNGKLFAEYKDQSLGKVKLEDFAKVFAQAYNAA